MLNPDRRQTLIRTGQSDRVGQWAMALGAATALVVLAFLLAETFGLRLNLSPSLPLGIYAVTDETNLVEFCPPEPFGSFAKRRGYRSAGSCPDGGTPLMKPIIARSGDEIELSDRGIAVKGKLLPKTAPRATDATGRPLSHWRFGKSLVPSGHIWVASTYSSRSYDSRYFGPLPMKTIRSFLRPLWIAP